MLRNSLWRMNIWKNRIGVMSFRYRHRRKREVSKVSAESSDRTKPKREEGKRQRQRQDEGSVRSGNRWVGVFHVV